MELQDIFDDCGLEITHYIRVYGGDINRSYCLHTKDEKYFLKLNEAKLHPGMFQKEADGLNNLKENSNIILPHVIKCGTVNSTQYLLLEWLDKSSPAKNFWEKFGSDLATMHKKPQPYFGYKEDNYIGSLDQINSRYQLWSLFYLECRIMPLVKSLFTTGAFSKQEVSDAESLGKKFNQIFPQESPSLLHGDLWSGNYMIVNKGHAAIYDPAVYYGQREMDIGMTKLFGGFDQRFYDAYNEEYPLEKNWQQRLPVTQLYPLLVHAVLFGGHYIRSAKETIKRFG